MANSRSSYLKDPPATTSGEAGDGGLGLTLGLGPDSRPLFVPNEGEEGGGGCEKMSDACSWPGR